jgi:thiamine pyrophosphokinase
MTKINPYALILANGEPPSKKLLRQLIRNADFFVCADGGANIAATMNVIPDAIIGDLDSATKKALRKLKNVPRYTSNDQYSTDLQKAVQWLIERHYKRIIILATKGKRIDHTFGNLGVLTQFNKKAEITFVDDFGTLMYVGKKKTIKVKPGTTISLLPITRCEGVTTKGLKFALHNDVLELGVQEGTSNMATKNIVMVSVKKGKLLIFILR